MTEVQEGLLRSKQVDDGEIRAALWVVPAGSVSVDTVSLFRSGQCK